VDLITGPRDGARPHHWRNHATCSDHDQRLLLGGLGDHLDRRCGPRHRRPLEDAREGRQAWWGAIIPIYNTYLIIKLAGRPGWWLILLFIPIVNFITMIIVSIDVAKNFGHGAGFAILLWLFPEFMYLVLGFGDSEYKPVTA
jgi:hypothetical protein